MRRTAIGLCGLVVGLGSPLLALGTHVADRDDDLVLVLANPFGPPVETIISQANLTEIYPERAPFGGFAAISGPEDAEKLRASGAFFLLSGERILALCGS